MKNSGRWNNPNHRLGRFKRTDQMHFPSLKMHFSSLKMHFPSLDMHSPSLEMHLPSLKNAFS